MLNVMELLLICFSIQSDIFMPKSKSLQQRYQFNVVSVCNIFLCLSSHKDTSQSSDHKTKRIECKVRQTRRTGVRQVYCKICESTTKGIQVLLRKNKPCRLTKADPEIKTSFAQQFANSALENEDERIGHICFKMPHK